MNFAILSQIYFIFTVQQIVQLHPIAKISVGFKKIKPFTEKFKTKQTLNQKELLRKS